LVHSRRTKCIKSNALLAYRLVTFQKGKKELFYLRTTAMSTLTDNRKSL
jgi:hypothetical protein